MKMSTVTNPILRGFNPDPSIIRVDDDYFIATSTFEWFPGVQIHHSTDLVNWELVARPLDRTSQLNLSGIPDSCGVWAPCLSYDNGIFYLVYSNVRSFEGPWKDTPNYLVITRDILGSWSEPLLLSSSGFDGSLFHDDDGKKWYLSMIVDHRNGKLFGGIILQEFDMDGEELTGPVNKIFDGSELGVTEGPHLYKTGGYYYLITAEGGTEYGHAVTVARSKKITGPYEIHPNNPIITSKDNPEHPLQKAGHADLVEAPDGKWYAAFLLGRPLTSLGKCTLGRETGLAPLIWKDGWPYLDSENKAPPLTLKIPADNGEQKINVTRKDDFVDLDLNIHFQSLRVPMESHWITLTERRGYLRLYGRESLSSTHKQSFLAQRVQSFHVQVSTCVEFDPESFQQMAGLVCYYNTGHYHYLFISRNDEGKRILDIISSDNFETSEPLEDPILLPDSDRVYLMADFDHDKIKFRYALKKDGWKDLPVDLDGSILSDDHVRQGGERYRAAFTGSFIGICCQDLSGRKAFADFEWFEYQEIE